MELAIETIFTYQGKTLKVVKDKGGCKDCAFKDIWCPNLQIKGKLSYCSRDNRTDYTSVIFKEVKDMPRSRRTINTEDNMQYNNTKDTVIINPPHKYESSEYKDIVINIPSDCEIDIENSDLAKGIIRTRSKFITFDDIYYGKVVGDSYSACLDVRCKEGNSRYDKLNAIAQLMDIAKYYNGDWKPDWGTCSMNKCYIYYDPVTNDKEHCYKVGYSGTELRTFVYFKNTEDAQAIIDNPNFKDILDTIYKN